MTAHRRPSLALEAPVAMLISISWLMANFTPVQAPVQLLTMKGRRRCYANSYRLAAPALVTMGSVLRGCEPVPHPHECRHDVGGSRWLSSTSARRSESSKSTEHTSTWPRAAAQFLVQYPTCGDTLARSSVPRTSYAGPQGRQKGLPVSQEPSGQSVKC